MGGVTKKLGNIVKNPIRSSLDAISGGAYEAIRNRFPNNPITGLDNKIDGYVNPVAQDNTLNGGAFSISPEEIAANRAAIEGLGDRTYGNTNQFVDQEMGRRQSARQAMAEALTKQSQASFQNALPGTMEDLNARHLLNGSGLGQEIARQQGQLAGDIANKVGTAGASDIDWASGARQGGFNAQQGAQHDALSRQFSLEDFIRSANVSKAIGAQMAPQVNNGKGNVVGGMGAGAAAGAPFGPWGAAIGGGAGAILGKGK